MCEGARFMRIGRLPSWGMAVAISSNSLPSTVQIRCAPSIGICSSTELQVCPGLPRLKILQELCSLYMSIALECWERGTGDSVTSLLSTLRGNWSSVHIGYLYDGSTYGNHTTVNVIQWTYCQAYQITWITGTLEKRTWTKVAEFRKENLLETLEQTSVQNR